MEPGGVTLIMFELKTFTRSSHLTKLYIVELAQLEKYASFQQPLPATASRTVAKLLNCQQNSS